MEEMYSEQSRVIATLRREIADLQDELARIQAGAHADNTSMVSAISNTANQFAWSRGSHSTKTTPK